MTIEKVYNLPKKFKDQDDPILDEDADVLVGDKTKVVKDDEPVDASELADAEHGARQGQAAAALEVATRIEDGQPVPTIRAKQDLDRLTNFPRRARPQVSPSLRPGRALRSAPAV